MVQFFTPPEYHTDINTPRHLLDRLSLNSRLYFVARHVNILFEARKVVSRGEFDTQAWAQASYDIFKHIEGCGGRFHITGLNHLAELDQEVVFVSNHMSTLETMIFPCLIAPFVEATFVIKESLARHKVVGSIMRSRNPIVVFRDNPREDLKTVMSEGQARLEKGISVIIFPQSTRTVSFVPEEFNSLGVKLAKKANVKIVPIAIRTDFWQNGSLVKDLGPICRDIPIHIAFGEPLEVHGNGREEHKEIVNFITNNLKDWNAI
ncbi:lysophospholipid acyltransferase family protein [Alkaliphilus peptidifermentans]|uniref:1-acyl-sn-glycerol-3-phosphate acyltransferase n=1 Tax=Alkaliphilus peptidifermentans DSM 18978 TaxID=1120976 RepID=A0A1G5DJ84_9FIRM|nr:lysophospholipid acyltransferase family protein [Alkaliphilus peptidifermentans]SCY14803.1 1-acyl-sn-glycerol-3-phosphate acyltransferase [Alkaliphilus peptidifermentans DSM 18978]